MELGHYLDSDDGSDNDDEEFTTEEVISYLVHKTVQSKGMGYIGGEKWAKLLAECR